MVDNQFFAQQGWQCPICKRVYSPTTSMCYYCGNTGTTTTDTATVTRQEGWWELLPTILTSYPPKYMWQCQRCGHGIITDDRSYPQSPCEKCGAGSKGDANNDH